MRRCQRMYGIVDLTHSGGCSVLSRSNQHTPARHDRSDIHFDDYHRAFLCHNPNILG
jgi:hypothetical protein